MIIQNDYPKSLMHECGNVEEYFLDYIIVLSSITGLFLNLRIIYYRLND